MGAQPSAEEIADDLHSKLILTTVAKRMSDNKAAFEEVEEGIKDTIKTVETANLMNDLSKSLKAAHSHAKIGELDKNVKQISKDFVKVKVGPPQ
jgi:archaellum component FlaC